MLRTLLIAALCGLPVYGQRVSEVVGAPPSLALETRPGDLFDAQKVAHDVHTLWSSGRVSDVQVEAVADGDSVRMIFLLKPKHVVRLRKVRVDPPTPACTCNWSRA